jgi:hypothetical protein
MKRSVHRASKLERPSVGCRDPRHPNRSRQKPPAGRLAGNSRGQHLSDRSPTKIGPLAGLAVAAAYLAFRPKASASATVGRTPPPRRGRSSPARTRRAMRPRRAMSTTALIGAGRSHRSRWRRRERRWMRGRSDSAEARVTQRTAPTLYQSRTPPGTTRKGGDSPRSPLRVPMPPTLSWDGVSGVTALAGAAARSGQRTIRHCRTRRSIASGAANHGGLLVHPADDTSA